MCWPRPIRAAAPLAVLLGAVLLLGGVPAHAEQVVLASKAPYWQVGDRDSGLSRACALGRFGPTRSDRYVARFSGPKGAATLAVAKGTGLNLYDPDHQASPTEDYFFLNVGTTSCEVFVGGRKPGGTVKPGG
jgi:hypothetical protein